MAYIRMDQKLTDIRTYATPRRVARPKVFPIRITLPLTVEMLASVDGVRAPKETRLEMIREAISREISRRERHKPK